MVLRQVKDTYKDVDEYLATFEPLLFEEVKAQILEGKDDEESNFLFPVVWFPLLQCWNCSMKQFVPLRFVYLKFDIEMLELVYG